MRPLGALFRSRARSTFVLGEVRLRIGKVFAGLITVHASIIFYNYFYNAQRVGFAVLDIALLPRLLLCDTK